MNNIEIIEKAKDFLFLPNINMATTQQVADFYKVGVEAIKRIVSRNRCQFNLDGYVVLKADDIECKYPKLKITRYKGGFNVCFENNQTKKCSARGIALFSKKAIIRIGFLLTDSNVAVKLRKEVSEEHPVLFNEFNNGHRLMFKKQEQKYIDYLNFSYGKENLKKQVRCGDYIIDCVLYNYIAVEIDEDGHSGYNATKEIERDNFIKDNGYILIRFNPDDGAKPYMLINNINNYLTGLRTAK